MADESDIVEILKRVQHFPELSQGFVEDDIRYYCDQCYSIKNVSSASSGCLEGFFSSCFREIVIKSDFLSLFWQHNAINIINTISGVLDFEVITSKLLSKVVNLQVEY